VQPLAQLVGIVVSARSPLARDDDPGRRDTRDTRDTRETDDLPSCVHPSRRLSRVDHLTLTLDEAVDIASTGDVWLFRGKSPADVAIRALTNSPVNHVGMVVAIDDLPPLLWHAELGRSLPDVWTGRRQRGVQLHHLPDAVSTWNERYRQRAWVRQLTGRIERHHEDRLMEIIARFDGRAFPTAPALKQQPRREPALPRRSPALLLAAEDPEVERDQNATLLSFAAGTAVIPIPGPKAQKVSAASVAFPLQLPLARTVVRGWADASPD
jgi:hypothetical protein